MMPKNEAWTKQEQVKQDYGCLTWTIAGSPIEVEFMLPKS